ncbi:MAG: protein-glutamine glutaminase family protein [Bdellovibrionia bacterium]
MKLFISIFVYLFTIQAHAVGLSAFRANNESFEDARHRALLEKQLKTGDFTYSLFYNRRFSAEGQKMPVDQLNVTSVPQIEADVLNKLFIYLRDSKFLKSKSQERRATWLYPDDGCYARAGIMSLNTEAITPVAPSKIFVFGDLNVKTPNTMSGWVTWWYHVAIAYNVNGEQYVIDPAIEPTRPLLMLEWLRAMNQDVSKLRVSLCHKDTYDPDSSCDRPRPFEPTDIYREQNMFLPLEWDRLLDLGRDPEVELGELPPWKAAL